MKQSLIGQLFIKAGWLPTLIFGVHLVLSLFDAYGSWDPTDKVLHVVGGMSMAFCFQRGLPVFKERFAVIDFSVFVHYVLSLALTGCATVVWEFGEYISDQIAKTQLQRGLEDTLSDMALGIVGGVVMLGLFYWFDAKKMIHAKAPRREDW